MKRILVTRSEPGASATGLRLLELGYAPVVEPLFELAPIPTDIPGFDALAFTSANGVRSFASLSSRRDAPVFVVGGRTAGVARRTGFANVRSADGDVDDLARLIERELPKTARLLHAGNEESRGDLAGLLRTRGIAADFRALYRAEPVSDPGPVLAAHLAGNPSFDAVLIHSPRAAMILKGFIGSAPRHAPIRTAAISSNAAEALGLLGVAVASSPDEASLFDALARLFA